MKRVFNLIILGLFSAVALQAWPGSFWKKDFSKVIIKEFDLKNNKAVDISNKYGHVEVVTWDEPTAKITVEIIVDARNEEDAEEVYDRIKILFNDRGDAISAATEITEGSSGWSWWGSNISSEFSINYKVNMPGDHHLRVYNKYGDCTVIGAFESSDYEIKYGNVTLKDEVGNVSLQLGYGKARLGNVGDGRFNIKYADLRMDDAENIKIESKYSNVRTQDIGNITVSSKYDDYLLGRVSSFKNNGKYDDFQIEEVADLEIQSAYTDVEINRLHHFAKSDMRYGELKIAQVSSHFRNIMLRGQYTEYVLGTKDLESFDIKAEGDYADWDWNCDIQHSVLEDEGAHYELVGYYRMPNSGRSIKANLSYGGLELR